MITLFADVILPIAVPNLYTYRVPQEWNNSITEGQRVVVNFGKGKLYAALVRNIHQNAPQKYAAKYIEHILDETPIVTSVQFQWWEWMASYYMCTLGEVMNAALPAALKLGSETKIMLHPNNQTSKEILSEKEFLLIDALEIRTEISLIEAAEIVERKTVYPIIKSLIDKGFVIIQEEIKEKYKPKIEEYIRLSAFAEEEENLKIKYSELEKKAFKQLEVLMAFIQLSKRYSGETEEVKKSKLMRVTEASTSVIQQLVKKNIFEIYSKEISRFEKKNFSNLSEKKLNDIQQTVFEKIKNIFTTKEVTLLHGVTSSGKTEVYIKLMQECIESGKQALYLLPEIALTAQIINRLQKHFGNNVSIYHSKLNDNERVEVWKNILQKNENNVAGKIIIGARSALFLPFHNLGLVIVDEEHDTSYKQYDPAPRYNARDSAIYLARIHGAKTLLGSATPSVETYYNAEQEKYGLVTITERFGGVEMPEIIVADIKEEKRKKIMKSHFSTILLEQIKTALANKEQAIVFHNRRGFAPVFECDTCGWIPHCIHCDVSLTYHKTAHNMRCHYCGYSLAPPTACEACGDTKLKMKGFGTEKIEEELSLYFPTARIMRMDLDTTRSKYAHQNIIRDFEDQRIDILVGTQMITKGLDFDNVSVVGILDADSMMNFPDFRSYERSFQMMAQVSGRAGRKSKRGKVIVQTYNPAHPVIQNVVRNDYASMYKEQILDRKTFFYPPFFRLLKITLKNKDADLLNYAADVLATELKQTINGKILGPEYPLVARIKNDYCKTILLKIEREKSFNQTKQVLKKSFSRFYENSDFKHVKLVVDVDPI
ncbi:MAG TPA: primosomal protein N' [Bacteroidia bacterium]|nr:primosomal protein N' [Bacteroidia bacterium]